MRCLCPFSSGTISKKASGRMASSGRTILKIGSSGIFGQHGRGIHDLFLRLARNFSAFVAGYGATLVSKLRRGTHLYMKGYTFTWGGVHLYMKGYTFCCGGIYFYLRGAHFYGGCMVIITKGCIFVLGIYFLLWRDMLLLGGGAFFMEGVWLLLQRDVFLC